MLTKDNIEQLKKIYKNHGWCEGCIKCELISKINFPCNNNENWRNNENYNIVGFNYMEQKKNFAKRILKFEYIIRMIL
jgi:hypothetical protein